MAKGQPKKKKAKKDVFIVNFHFDGIFTSWPLKYCQGQVRVMTDTNFDEMSYEVIKEIAKKLVPRALFEKIYYCQTGVKLTLGLREIKSTQDIAEMIKVGYESGNEINMSVEHFGYDIMELVKLKVNQEDNHNNIEESDDEYYGSDDYEEIENVDFQTEGDESVVIKSISTHDPFLTKLCSARIMVRGLVEHQNTEAPLADPDDHQIHAVNKVQSGVLYPAFDPDIHWDKMKPTLGMRYETPYQLKLALANYGVAHGYQLWYKKNDWREVLVYYGRNVEEGRCAGKKGNKDRTMKNKVRSGVKIGVKKKVVKKKVGLIDAVNDWLPEAEHRKCTRHIYANFKKKYSGLLYQRLFWAAASCTLEQQFMQIMDQIKQLDEGAYDYLIKRNPNSWSRAFFEMDRRCAAFENGISESFNRAILEPRHKPIITMLEEIRLYIMQRLVAMNKIATNLQDTITPSIRKRLEVLKEKQREWLVIPSGFQELEVRKDDQSYGVNLQHKVCQCRMWELSGVPCVHAVAAYLHCGIEIDLGVSHWYSQDCWYNAYQFSIKPVFGSNMWKRTNDVPPLPPLVRRMPGRPQKSRIKDPGETSGSHTSRVGRTMTCTNCWQKGHNKATCKADPTPKPPAEKKPPGRNKQSAVGYCASRGRGRGRGGSENEASVSGMGGIDEASGGGRGGTGGRGGMAGSSSMGLLTSEELDEEAFRECMEEQAREQAKNDAEQERLDKERREEIEWEEKNDYFNPANFREDSLEEAPFNHTYAEVLIPSIHSQPTQQSGVWVKDTTDVTTEYVDEFPGMETSETTNVAEGIGSAMEEELPAPAVDKGKGVASVAQQDSAPKKKRGRPPSHVDGVRIYHKNRGRSERIAKMKEKKAFEFDKHGTGSTPDKAFDVSD
ncbi:zinc finger, PMZ-type containing protein [Tanacetum coccineum]